MSRLNDSHVIRDTLGTARAQLDDLQAELEAGSRQAEKIQTWANHLEEATDGQREAADELQHLMQRVGELRGSLQDQRALMRQLRESLDLLRRQLGSQLGKSR